MASMADATEGTSSQFSPPQRIAEATSVRGYIDGCFDIMHSGHYNAIRQAKCICDLLIVGVHSDPEIEENKALPVMKQDERYALLEHIKWIDEIIHDVPYSPQLATLERARADFCAHGDDMPVNAQGVCAYDEMRLAGKLRIIKRTEGVSTTDLIGRLLTLSRQHHSAEKDTDIVGMRVSAADAIEHLALPTSPEVSTMRSPSRCMQMEAPLEIANDLAKKYGISDADLERLKASVRQCFTNRTVPVEEAAVELPPPAVEEVAPAASADRAEDVLRTQAPVHLLASTRRISEFASSKMPREGDRVVYVSGAFDMFHVGHAQFLKDAREFGDFLLVGIHEDLTVSRAKGPSFPVMNLTERVLNVCACKWVDEVIIGAPRGVTEDLIKTWGVHVVARGTGHMRNEGDEQGTAPFEVPRRLHIYKEVTSKWPDLCHDTIVKRIMASRQLYLKRNKDRARREDDYYKKKSSDNSPIEA
mmetsp:Transcript_16828/g.31257  ORF Transcript_16828/g.31257 Transcript_16828/m.31257 type:complete len:474 (-) Transcript_16828:112-1533(-)